MDIRRIRGMGMKLTIYRKLLLIYLAMVFLTVLASAYAIFSLQQLNELAYRIINEDFAVVDQSKSLLDTLIARESAEKRYLILRDPTLEEIYWSRSREFSRIFAQMQKSQFSGIETTISRLALLHGQYETLFSQEVGLVQGNQTEDAQVLSEGPGKKAIDEMALLVRAVQKKAEGDIDARMNRIKVQSLRASRLTVVLSLVSLVVGILLVLLVTYNISRPLRRLEKATAVIAEGKFWRSGTSTRARLPGFPGTWRLSGSSESAFRRKNRSLSATWTWTISSRLPINTVTPGAARSSRRSPCF
jgi:CHASE3 domain sensor protein